MGVTKSWLRGGAIAAGLLFLGGCAHGIDSALPVTSVADLGSNFKPIPLRVAVYVAPQVLDSHAVYDNYAKSKYHYVVDVGRTGPAVAAAVAKYAPLAFEKAYLVSNYPDRRLMGKPIDAVFVIEHVAERRRQSAAGEARWDVSISGGLYRPDGAPITRYSVVASRMPKSRAFADAGPGWIAWEVKNAMAAVSPAVRLLLWRFPRGQALAGAARHGTANREASVGKRHAHYWQRQRATFMQRIARDRPKLPVPTLTLMEYAKLLDRNKPNAKALASEVEGAYTDIAAQQYPGIPLAYDRQMMDLGALNRVAAAFYARQFRLSSSGRNPGKAPLQFQRLSRIHTGQANGHERR